MDAPPNLLSLPLQGQRSYLSRGLNEHRSSFMKEEGPSGGPDLPVSPGTLGGPDTCLLNALTLIPESKALITGPPRCASASAIASVNASASEVPRHHERPLHVQFDVQPSAAPKVRPPDGGLGWVIVFAAFMVHFTAGGITFSFGMFLSHFLEYFGEDKRIAFDGLGDIFMAMPLLSGPIASFLTDRYGCRWTTICGSILAAIGFLITSFVDNMETLFFTFGIIAGFGLSLCYVAAVVIVAYYFEKKRSLATGISMCGSGIGTFIFAPLTHDWLDKYGWRGTTLILAGLLLNMAVCGLLFRDLPWTATMNQKRAKERKRRRKRKRNKRLGLTIDSLTDSKSSDVGHMKATDPVDIEAATISIVPQYSSLVDLPTYMTGGEGVSLETFELMSSHNSVSCAPDTNGTRQFNDKAALLVHWYTGLWDFYDWVLDFSHFLNPAFLVFAVSNFLVYVWYNAPYVPIADTSLNMGLNHTRFPMLISVIGILKMFAKIILGWVGDCVNPSLVYAVCMVFCGLVSLIMPVLTSYLSLTAASGAFGFFIAATYSLTSKIMVEQITLQKFTNAYGLLLLMQGIASLIGSQMGNWAFGISGSYDLTFYIEGVFIGISGLILIVSPVYNATLRYNNYRKRKSGQVRE